MADKDAISAVSPASTCVASFSRSSTAHDAVWNRVKIPFNKSVQLCNELEYSQKEPDRSSCLRSNTSRQTLPDAPRIRLTCPSAVVSYCLKDLDTPGLNKLGEKLWWAGPTPDVVSLSQHAVLDRRIQVVENPSLHLLWTEGILYVKPIPAYLTSFAFWDFLMDTLSNDIGLEERSRLKATCLGFLKTYACLIQHRSDFNLARRYDLLGSLGDVSFEVFVAFIASFDAIPEREISSRWHYGLLELDAINFHSAIHLRRWHLNRFQSRYTTYFSRFFPVILFMVALFSVMLSAMQVIVAIKQLGKTDNKGLNEALGLFEWFSTESICWSMGFGIVLLIWWVGISINEIWHTRQTQRRVRKELKANMSCRS
jgi:hypothetical protein